MVLVVILVVAWLVILGPSLLRRRSDHGDGVSSISHFHHQLRVLEHSGGKPIVRPAYRLQSKSGTPPDGDPRYPDVADVPVLHVVGADKLPRPALAFLGDGAEDEHPPVDRAVFGRPDGFGPSEGPPLRTSPARLPERDGRALARRRRRDTLTVLTLVFVATVLIGFIPGARSAWVASAIFGVVLAAYVAMLVHLRSMAEEREQKLRYLRPRSDEVADGLSADGRREPAGEWDDDREAFADGRPYRSYWHDHPAGRAAAR